MRPRFASVRGRTFDDLKLRWNPDLQLVPRTDSLLAEVPNGVGRTEVESGRRFRQVFRVEGQPSGDKENYSTGN